ncbi:UPF0565 protein C2orf69 [Caerostris extrusa]|uniref:UPF0565 protein C2orf69 n=1 Tax=Caerostris extrusa TaxID=172846 RepID=A0AAV4NKT1_CAEEX|nr:UPF0565 protein C2orf69 [Caerostris extrusa]
MASDSMMSDSPSRLGKIDGYLDRSNEIVYHSPICGPLMGYVIFFGGDMQDYKENMLAHRDNKHYSKWDLESTAVLLHNHFPQHAVIIVKPAKMSLMTFSCYENFVNVNNFGAPTYVKSLDSIKHLKLLLTDITLILQNKLNETSPEQKNDLNLLVLSEAPLILIGFSKGCVVLNQLLYSFHFLQENKDQELESFVNRISNVQIHVTPYQVFCDTRPRIGKEEKIFRENLTRMGMNISRKLHFEQEPRSLEKHFEVLEVFKAV